MAWRQHGVVDIGTEGDYAYVSSVLLRSVFEKRQYAIGEDKVANVAGLMQISKSDISRVVSKRALT